MDVDSVKTSITQPKRPSFFGDRTPEQIKKAMDAYMRGKVGHHVGPVSYKEVGNGR